MRRFATCRAGPAEARALYHAPPMMMRFLAFGHARRGWPPPDAMLDFSHFDFRDICWHHFSYAEMPTMSRDVLLISFCQSTTMRILKQDDDVFFDALKFPARHQLSLAATATHGLSKILICRFHAAPPTMMAAFPAGAPCLSATTASPAPGHT